MGCVTSEYPCGIDCEESDRAVRQPVVADNERTETETECSGQ